MCRDKVLSISRLGSRKGDKIPQRPRSTKAPAIPVRATVERPATVTLAALFDDPDVALSPSPAVVLVGVVSSAEVTAVITARLLVALGLSVERAPPFALVDVKNTEPRLEALALPDGREIDAEPVALVAPEMVSELRGTPAFLQASSYSVKRRRCF